MVVYLPEAEAELREVPVQEAVALRRATEKLTVLGDRLGYPHSSAVRGAGTLRELRPRGGRSAWRALYRRVGKAFVVAAVGPEAQHDRRGFDRTVRDAIRRLDEVED